MVTAAAEVATWERNALRLACTGVKAVVVDTAREAKRMAENVFMIVRLESSLVM